MNVTPELLKRYHLGECTADEHAAVDAWLEEDTIFPAEQVPEISSFQLARSRTEMWEFLKENIPQKDLPAPVRSRRTVWRWLPAVAAAIALIGLTTVGVKYAARLPQQETTMLQSNVPYGKKRILTLSDGTKVYLNAGATLHYPKAFLGDSREVKLVGEAYFEVTASEKYPFIIRTAYDTQVKVVGTAFNVRAEPNSPRVEVAVSKGTVHFMHSSNHQGIVKLQAGQFAIYDNVSASFVEGYASISFIGQWRENKLIFDQDPLDEAFKKITRWYGYNINVSKKQLLSQRYNAQYESPKLRELLQRMAFVLDFQYKIDDENKTINIY